MSMALEEQPPPPPPPPQLSISEIVSGIVADEGGWGGLFKGWESPTAGYFFAGGVGFGLTEYFRRLLLVSAGGSGGLLEAGLDPVVATIVASLVAGVFATVSAAPFEKARVRLQSAGSSVGSGETEKEIDRGQGQDQEAQAEAESAQQQQQQQQQQQAEEVEEISSGAAFVAALGELWGDPRGPVPGLFDNVPLLLLRDTIYSVVKFVAFDGARGLILSAAPELEFGGLAANLQVSLGAGSLAGVAAALASQPGDTIFTKLANEGDGGGGDVGRSVGGGGEPVGEEGVVSDAEGEVEDDKAEKEDGKAEAESGGSRRELWAPAAAVQEVVAQQGVGGLYAGALPRAVFAASLLALEFVIYDYCRAVLKVSSSDLLLTLDVLAGLRS